MENENEILVFFKDSGAPLVFNGVSKYEIVDQVLIISFNSFWEKVYINFNMIKSVGTTELFSLGNRVGGVI